MIVKTTPPSIAMVRIGAVSVPFLLPGMPVVVPPQQTYLPVPAFTAFHGLSPIGCPLPPPLLSRQPEPFNASPVLTTSAGDQPQKTVATSTSNSGVSQKEVTFEAVKEELLAMDKVQYQRFLRQYDANNEVVRQLKLIRRREKNKRNAHDCRSRKIKLINSLDSEVHQYKVEKNELQAELAELTKQRDEFIKICNRYPEKPEPYIAND